MTREEIRQRALRIVANRVKREMDDRRPKAEPTPLAIHNTTTTESMVLKVDHVENTIQHLDPVIHLSPNIDLRPNVTVEPAQVHVEVPEGKAPIVNVEAAQVHIDMAPVADALTKLAELLRPRKRVLKFVLDSDGKPIGAEIING